MSLNYFCFHLPLHFTTTHCLSLPLQSVSDNGTSIMNVIELLLSSSSSPLHYHTLSISTTAGGNDNDTSIMNVIELLLSSSSSPLHYLISLPLQDVSDNGIFIVNAIELLLSPPFYSPYFTLLISNRCRTSKMDCYTLQ